MNKPKNTKVLRFVCSAKRAGKLRKRGEAVTWDLTQGCWAWLNFSVAGDV